MKIIIIIIALHVVFGTWKCFDLLHMAFFFSVAVAVTVAAVVAVAAVAVHN